MSWRTFASRAAFDAWHAAEKAARGFPVRGVNAKTGQPAAAGVGVTTDIVAPILVSAVDVRAELPYTEERDDKGNVTKALPGSPAVRPVLVVDTDGKPVLDKGAATYTDAVAEPILEIAEEL